MKQETKYFFSRCRNAVSVSDIIVAMAAGTPLVATRIPNDMLPAVLLLATIGLRTYNQQIVDDYLMLFVRMEEMFKDATLSNADYDHPSLSMASMVTIAGPRGEYWLDSHSEAAYMFTAYEELVNAELSSLFQPPVKVVAIKAEKGKRPQQKPQGKATKRSA